jgi:general secretion pathway protein D
VSRAGAIFRAVQRAACVVVLSLCGLCAAGLAAAQTLELDLRQTELSEIVDRIAAFTGERVIYDDRLRGRVTLTVPYEVDAREAMEMLHATLLLGGFAAVPGPAGSWKISPIQDANAALPWLRGTPDAQSSARVSTLVRLREVKVDAVARSLQPLLGDQGLMIQYPPTNSLIIATTEARLRRLLHLLRALDQASERVLRIVGVRYRDVDEIIALAREALQSKRVEGDAVRLVADARTGSILLDGPLEEVRRARDLVRRLDVPRPGKGSLHVVRILNADAQTLGEHLGSLADGSGPDALIGASYQVVVDGPTHSLVIEAAPATFAVLADLIAQLDVPAPRVAVEMQVIEVSSAGSVTLGFDALLPLTNADSLTDGTNILLGVGDARSTLQVEPTTVAGVSVAETLGIFPPDETFVVRGTRTPVLFPIDVGTETVVISGGGVQIRAEAGEVDVHSVIQPHLVMISGEEHRIVAGDNVPIPVSSADTTQLSNRTDVSIQREDTGVDMRVTPIVISDDLVRLDVELEVKDVVAPSAGVDASLGPTISTKEVSVQARLRSGDAMLIAALRDPSLREIESGVPFLKELPFVGQFFRTTRTSKEHRHLIVTAEALILTSASDQLAYSIQRRLAFERQLARVEPLDDKTDAPWAILVTTATTEDDAQAIAYGLGDLDRPIEIIPWSWHDRQYFDVYVTGFASLAETSPVSLALRRAAWQPSLTVVPEALQ